MFKYTEEQIKAWKEKWGENNVFVATVDDKCCVLHKPRRQDYSYAMVASNGGKDPVKLQEALLNGCWIDGDNEIKTEDSYFFSVSAQIEGMSEVKQAELKKL